MISSNVTPKTEARMIKLSKVFFCDSSRVTRSTICKGKKTEGSIPLLAVAAKDKTGNNEELPSICIINDHI